jgi:hypothetical protein
MAHWYRPEGPLDPDTLAERYADLFLGGLQATHGRTPMRAGAYDTARGNEERQ